jgi:hypothetical protein
VEREGLTEIFLPKKKGLTEIWTCGRLEVGEGNAVIIGRDGGKFAFRGKQWNEGGMMCEKWN